MRHRFHFPALSLALGLSLLAAAAQAQSAAPAAAAAPATSPTRVLLWPEGAPGALGAAEKDKPKVDAYLPSKETANGAGIVILPGGGYAHLSMLREGSEIARWLNKIGVAGFVVTYRLGGADGYQQPVMQDDAARAIRLVRSRAAEWGVDPKRLGVIGFSAGGHLASTIGTHFDEGKADAADPIDRVSCRPDFLLLLYPVISMKDGITHKGSHDAFLGPNPDAALVEKFSNETQVTAQTPPAFLVHSTADLTVPVKNSLLFYEALVKAGVPAEMHIFEKGAHGFALGTDGQNRPLRGNPPMLQWPKICEAWLQNRGFLTKAAPTAADGAKQ